MADQGNYLSIVPKAESVPNTSSDDSRSQRNKRRKSSPVPAACQNCRQRKAKCDALRPVCYSCRAAGLACSYDLPEGLTPREAVKRNLRHLEAVNGSLRAVIEYMRECSEDECRTIVRRIRQAASVDEAVQELVDASLLLRDTTVAAGPAGWGSEAGDKRAGGTPSEAGEPPSSPDMPR